MFKQILDILLDNYTLQLFNILINTLSFIILLYVLLIVLADVK
jgi:hypothetical protein